MEMLNRLRRRSSLARPSSLTASSTTTPLTEFSFLYRSLSTLFAELERLETNPALLYEECQLDAAAHMQKTLDALLKYLRTSKPKAFISHFKLQSGTSAQLLVSMMEKNGLECFLDSDDLVRLDQLAFQVMASTHFYLLMSPYDSVEQQFGPFGRPYCVVEIVTWYLYRKDVQAKVVLLQQTGKTTSRFPATQEEMNAALDDKAWDMVRTAVGRSNAHILAFEASLALQHLDALEWTPNHTDRAVSMQQFKAILESSGITAVFVENDAKKLKKKANNAATTAVRSAGGSNRLQISILFSDDAQDEASLIATRTEAEFADQVGITTNLPQQQQKTMGTFALVLMTPKLLHDLDCLQSIALAVEQKCTLVPVLVSRIGLDQFDYSQSPSSSVVNTDVLEAFAHVKTILAKPLAPHSSSNQVSVQLGAIWGVMGISNASSQFRGVPYLQDPYTLVLNKADKYVSGTREWIFKAMEDWATVAGSSNVFVLVSTAGLGKSVAQAEFCRRYSSSVAARAKKHIAIQPSQPSNITVAAFHFFKHDDAGLNDARVAIGSIARQLANNVDGFRVCLEDSLKTCTMENLKDLETLFRKCVLEPCKRLSEMITLQASLVVVLDGLDECLDRAILTPLLITLWPQVPMLRLVVSTRPGVSAWEKFTLLMLKPDYVNNQRDLRVFLEYKLGASNTEAIDIVERNAKGLFLYATFACDQLRNMQPESMQSAARDLPVSMDGIYVDYFSALQQEFFDDPMLYTGALAPVLASRVPLPEQIWIEACFEASSSLFTKRVSGSQLSQLKAHTEFNKRVKEPLLRLLDFNNGTVSFLHTSMAEFLQNSPQLALRVDASIGHELLAQVCKRFTFSAPSWERLHGSEEVFVAAHSLYHFTKCGKIERELALDSVMNIDKLIRNIRVAKLDSNYDRLVDDVRMLEDEVIVKFTLSLLVLVEKAVMRDPRELAGQILARVMIPEFDADQQYWVDQARSWITRSGLKVPVPAFFGRGGLQPAGTAMLRIIEGYHTIVGAVAFAPDGKFVAVGSGQQTKLCDVKTGKLIKDFVLHQGAFVRAVCIAPNSKFIVTAGNACAVTLWDIVQGTVLRELPQQQAEVTSVAISPDSRYVVTGAKTNKVTVYDLDSSNNSLVHKEIGHASMVNSVAIAPNGTFMVCGVSDTQTYIYSFPACKSRTLLKGHSKEVLSVSVSPDSTLICTASDDKGVKLWDVKTSKVVHKLNPHGWGVNATAFSPDGTYVVTGCQDKMLRIFSVKTGELLNTLKGHGNHIYSIAISPDSSLIISGSTDRTARLWDAKTQRKMRNLDAHKGRVRAVSISPDGKQLVTGSNDRSIKLWDLSTNQVTGVMYSSQEGVTAAKFTPDGKYIVSSTYDKIVRVWENDQVVRTMEGMTGPARELLFTADSKFVLATQYGAGGMIWEIETGNVVEEGTMDRSLFIENEDIVSTTREGFVSPWGDDDTVVGITLEMENNRLVRFGNKLIGYASDSFQYWTLDESESLGTLVVVAEEQQPKQEEK